MSDALLIAATLATAALMTYGAFRLDKILNNLSR